MRHTLDILSQLPLSIQFAQVAQPLLVLNTQHDSLSSIARCFQFAGDAKVGIPTSASLASHRPTYSNDTTARPAELRYCGNFEVAEGLVPDFFTLTAFHNGERRQWRISDGWLLVTLILKPSARWSAATAAIARMPM